MHEFQWLAERFEADRTHLRSVAYRMLGSLSEAEDAVQEAWLRLSRSGVAEVENLGGWMTTAVARGVPRHAALAPVATGGGLLRPRAGAGGRRPGRDRPEQDAVLGDSIGLA